MNDSLNRITAEIGLTNNGKLMISRIRDRADRDMVQALVAAGHLEYARFIEARDSVRLPGAGLVDRLERDPCSFSPRRIPASPDYESMILARQEAAGWYD